MITFSHNNVGVIVYRYSLEQINLGSSKCNVSICCFVLREIQVLYGRQPCLIRIHSLALFCVRQGALVAFVHLEVVIRLKFR